MEADPHKNAEIWHIGRSIENAKAVMIMVHGRGADAQDILSLSDEFTSDGIFYIAPQASGGSWYPNSFLSPIDSNEPYLSSALNLLGKLVDETINKGISADKIFLLGFSQGACLSLEFAVRNPKKFGGIFALSGGLIGPSIDAQKYSGDFDGCNVFLGCSEVDPHIPKARVDESAKIFEKLNARVEKSFYKNIGHTINYDEIDFINKRLEII
jgi:phospholipase/carboxylesterase